MSKQRYVRDSFWTDPYIEKITPDEKLIFLYLLTNPQCNVAGVYEIRPKRIAYETGYDIDVIEIILQRFQRDKKIIRIDDWLIIINHLKHQALGNSTATGINRIIKESPQKVQDLFNLKTLQNSRDEQYEVLVLLSDDTPPIDPLQTPPFVPYSEVKLSRVKLSRKESKNLVVFSEFNNVNLSEEESKKLEEKIGEEDTKDLIEELGQYIASTGKKYSSHYATLLSWHRRKSKENSHIRQKPIAIIPNKRNNE